MSRTRQTLLGRAAFAALTVAALTFGGVQALQGAPAQPPCASGYTCTTRPSDSGCAAYCLQQYPQNLGTHFCNTNFCCVCAT